MIVQKQFGFMVALKENGMMGPVTLKDAINKIRRVDPAGELVMTARALGISFGD
jgi:6-phosphofructokinase 1